MSDKIQHKVLRALPVVGAVFVLLFATTFFPSLYFFSERDGSTYFLVIRALLIAGTPILFIPVIYRISIKKSIFKDWKNLLLHICLSLIFCFSFLLIYQILSFFILDGENFLARNYESIAIILERQFFSIGSDLFFSYWGIVVLFGLKKYYEELDEIQRKSYEIQSQLEQATLSSLQAQLKPHFLFNTLSMIEQMLGEKPKKSAEMVDKLERLLRNTFDRNNSESCTIREEIEFLKKYLSIEESRFQDRLTVVYSIAEATEDIRIPRYLLQPLVENAIVHGVSKTMKESEVKITSEFVDGYLQLAVVNNLHGLRMKKSMGSKGIGLKNVEERIALFFGEKAQLQIDTSNPKKFTSKILIPGTYLKKEESVFVNSFKTQKKENYGPLDYY